MTGLGLLWVLLAAAFNTGALALLRLAGGGIQYQAGVLTAGVLPLLYLLAGLMCYGVAFLLTVRILALSSFIVAVPVFVALQFVFSSVLALLLLGESLSGQGWLGLLVILLGIVLLVLGAE